MKKSADDEKRKHVQTDNEILGELRLQRFYIGLRMDQIKSDPSKDKEWSDLFVEVRHLEKQLYGK